MSRYTVDLDELMGFVERLERFNQRAEAIAGAVDREITALHGTWDGLGADAEKEYHRTWMRLAREMRDAADELRRTAKDAHRNYTDVAVLNSAMWP